ncbi:hypothetical protein [Hymenobacter psychrophilus]|uniref:Uncharacterized protein n=1 Tax=Hymenobacter psychrophilus TaxID=651662 RepID=A0A1H3DGX5_9BACT|nr:hypothetical protein [Hymenobacter psychrophilus]SDX64949.1 hypothetical protein SAMN04488069_102334 [Hymenobacter psychrophilus]
MRYLPLLLVLLLLQLPALAQTDGRHAQPTDHDDTVILLLPDADRAAWQRVGRLLAQRGYPIRYASPELLTLTTEPIDVENIGVMGLLVVVEGHELRLQAYTPSSGSESARTWLNVQDWGRWLGGTSRYWEEVEQVARLLGGTAQYTRSISN